MKFGKVAVLFVLCAKFGFTSAVCEEETVLKNDVLKRKVSYPYKMFMYSGTISECNCDAGKTCIRKCCDLNYVLNDDVCVYNDTDVVFNVHQDKNVVQDELVKRHFVTGTVSCPNSYQLEPDNYPEDEFYLQIDGKLWLSSVKKYFTLDEFCVDYIDGFLWALACVPPVTQYEKTISIAGMIISMPFLLLTFIVYSFLPEKKVHAKSLMCYVLTLFIAYAFLCIINSTHMMRSLCVTIGKNDLKVSAKLKHSIVGLLCLFFFTASFFWMNVMSIDIFLTFSGERDLSRDTKDELRRNFRLYSLYSWGVPSLLVTLVACLNTFADKGSWYNPSIGEGVCWLSGGVRELMYFYAPLSMIILLNLCMFSITALKIRKVQKDAAVLRSPNYKIHREEEKRRFKLYIRLSLAMGVNWIMEIISWAVNWQIGSVARPVWYLTDFCNAVYGVIIFFIFVCNKRIWMILKNRYNCKKKQEKLDQSLPQTIETKM
ncbi:hypothetical protein FQA39_LY07775 [Lamprigera yunnana]|nr:hypothetical protein FQA39_LY07775 [Lamprigera yunnana]